LQTIWIAHPFFITIFLFIMPTFLGTIPKTLLIKNITLLVCNFNRVIITKGKDLMDRVRGTTPSQFLKMNELNSFKTPFDL